MAKTTVNFTKKDHELIEELKDHFDANTLNDAVRQAVAQSSVLSRYVNDKGELVLLKEDGEKVTIVRR